MSARQPRKPKRRLPKRRIIGVPRRGGVSIAQQGQAVLPRGRASNLPRGKKVIRRGLREKESFAAGTVRRSQFAQRTGIQQDTFAGGEFKFPKIKGLPRRTFRMDGLGL